MEREQQIDGRTVEPARIATGVDHPRKRRIAQVLEEYQTVRFIGGEHFRRAEAVAAQVTRNREEGDHVLVRRRRIHQDGAATGNA